MTLLRNPLNTVSVVRSEDEIKALRAEIRTLRRELYALASKLACYPEPPRENWQSTKARIAHVRLAILKDSPQMVTSYDEDWRELPEYSGPFYEVGLRVLAQSEGIKWEQVEDFALAPTLITERIKKLL